MPVFCVPCPALHCHHLSQCHFHDTMELLALEERNLTYLEWSQLGIAGLTTDNGPFSPFAIKSHTKQWKHHSIKAWLSSLLGAWLPTTAMHWDPVTTNSGAHGSWGSLNCNISLWEHTTHPSQHGCCELLSKFSCCSGSFWDCAASYLKPSPPLSSKMATPCFISESEVLLMSFSAWHPKVTEHSRLLADWIIKGENQEPWEFKHSK